MADTWKIIAVNKEDDILGEFGAQPVDPGSIYVDLVAQLLQCDGSAYDLAGKVSLFEVLRNNNLYAKCHCDTEYAVYAGQTESGQLMVKKSEVVYVEPVLVCTCGGWSVYGKEADLHSFVCDLRM